MDLNQLQPPYYAVIFTARRTAEDEPGYSAMAERMVGLAGRQPGFLGIEWGQGPDGSEITISYWSTREAIQGWRSHAEHQLAQQSGRQRWYDAYQIRICRVEEAYGFQR